MALKKALKPTYDHKVEIPVPGAKPEKCGFVFIYKTEDEYEELKKSKGHLPVVEFLALLIDSWDADDFADFGEFSVDALKEVANIYPGAPTAIMEGYLTSRYRGRLGN